MSRITPQGYDYPNKVTNPFWDDSGTVDDYEELRNKPSINGITLVGDKTSRQLLITPTIDDENLTFN